MNGHEQSWIRTENSTDLLNCLEQTLDSYKRTHEDLRHWKWCIIAAHGAAQIAMVIALNALGEEKHLTSTSRKALVEYLEASRSDTSLQRPDTKLASFLDLYEGAKSLLPEGKATAELKRDLKRLNSLRKDWIHFGDYGTSVSTNYAIVALRAGIQLIFLLGLVEPEYLYSTREQAQRHRAVLDELLTSLARA